MNEASPLLKDTGKSKLNETWPSKESNCWSSVFFAWLTPILKLGNTRALEFEDLYQLDPENRAKNVYLLFTKKWGMEKSQSNRPRLWMALSKAFGFPFLLAGGLKLVHDSLLFVSPMVIKAVIAFLQDSNATLNEGLLYVLAIFASGVIQSFCLRQYFFYCYQVGMRLRTAVVTAVYDKTLKLSSAARQRSSTGEITNLMSIDAQRLQDVTPFLHGLWYGFYQIIVAIYLLWQQLGPSCLAGIAVIILSMPVTGFISKLMRTLQKRLMAVKDDRIKICYDVLNGMKVIKLQAWENSYIDRVMQYRREELNKLKSYIFARAGSTTIFSTIPSFVAIASFMSYVFLGHSLDVSIALTSLSLFNILRFPLFMLPQVINNVVEASVSFKRLTRFLLEEERDPIGTGDLTESGVQIDNATFVWEEAKEDGNVAGIRDVNMSLRMGDYCVIVGSVGSGKTTLLSSILGETRRIKGNQALKGSVAYVSQQAFIQNATLRDNILFGREMNHELYQQAIKVSALAADLKALPDGDDTEIGEKGINLSGGQRMRVSIARAVYQDADIYVLDDPLAAVDAHVGRQIYEECIVNQLKSKLRILVTNGLSYVKNCKNVFVIKDGAITQRGTYEELESDKNGALAALLSSEKQTDEKEQPPLRRASTISTDDENEVAETLERIPSIVDKKSPTALMTLEDRSVGDVNYQVYKDWVKAAGGLKALIVIIIGYLITQALNIGTTVWLSLWSENATKDTERFYLYVYIGLSLVTSLVVYFQSLLLYFCGLAASTTLFRGLLSTIMQSPMSFFDTTPMGRIINRMSKDIYTLDEQIPSSWGMYLRCIFSAVATLFTIIYVTPAFVVALIPVFFGYWTSQRYFIKTSRELQRLDSMSRSPVYALLGETLDGLTSIHAYNAATRFTLRNNEMLNRNQRAYFLNFSSNCWLALRLEFAGTLIATGAALFAVLEHGDANTVFAGLAGVSLSYAFTVTQMLNWSVRMVSQLQTQMVSVERIQTYTDLPTEAAKIDGMDVPQDWPSKGEIEFSSVMMRYRPGLPLVLNGLSFSVKGGEKLAVVGRTGAGKSSLAVALMRLVDIEGGKIMIDNIDTSSIGLYDLRSNISIIPQDPVLFTGTIRTNLDPFHRCDDATIWNGVRRAHLGSKVTSLDQPVSEGGGNFSVGERQLLCIARSLLNNAKVILMDEATASIDMQTDNLIQETIRKEFKQSTVLTIAHRINTVLDSDRIMVMDNGSVAELDTPKNLLKMKKGMFKSLYDEWKKGSAM